MKQKSNLFDWLNIIFFSLIALLCIVPYIHLIAKSFSDAKSVASGTVGFWPKGFHLNAYKYIIVDSYMANALMVSFLVTVIGTAGAMTITVMCAYPLSKQDLPGRRGFLLIVVFSMLFYGGIVPSYLLMRTFNLINTMAGMIVPLIFTPFNMLVMKTFFENIPDSIMESARIDGAGNFRTLVSIVLPISLPVLATIGMYYGVAYWNSYFHPMLFITKRELKPLQIFLQEIINSSGDIEETSKMQQMINVTMGNAQASAIIVATLPIIMAYPFLQKYFVHGLTVGSTKG